MDENISKLETQCAAPRFVTMEAWIEFLQKIQSLPRTNEPASTVTLDDSAASVLLASDEPDLKSERERLAMVKVCPRIETS